MSFSSADYIMMQARLQKNGAAKPAPDAVEDESKLHGQIAEYCRSRGWLCFHSMMHRRSTSSLGMPDFIVCGDNGKFWMIECKSRTGKLRPEQAAIAMAARVLGHTVFCVRSLREFVDAVKV